MVKLPDIGLGWASLLYLTDLPKFIDVAGRHGFHRIAARPYAFALALQNGHSEASLQRRLKDAGIQVTMIDALLRDLPGLRAPDSIDPKLRSILQPDMINPLDQETCMNAASVLGANILNVVPFLGERVPVDQMAEGVSAICRNAAARGIQISLEFMPNSGISDLPYALAVLKTCNEPNCRLLLDTTHVDRTGATVEDIRNLPAGSVNAIQISDRVPPPPGTQIGFFQGRLMPGEGKLPLREMVTAVLEKNPTATIDIEVLNPELLALPPDDAARRLAAAANAWRTSFGG